MKSEESNLKYIDLSDNLISDLRQIFYLNRHSNIQINIKNNVFIFSLSQLETLIFETDADSNPICQQKNLYYSALRKTSFINNLYVKKFSIVSYFLLLNSHFVFLFLM